MSVAKFANHLYGTPLSTAIRETSWIIPGVQSIHIIAIAGVVGAAIVMDLRLAGVLATDEAPRAVVKRHLPWMWSSLALLLASGFVLGLGEPYRVLMNPVFWAKMALVLTGFVLSPVLGYSPAVVALLGAGLLVPRARQPGGVAGAAVHRRVGLERAVDRLLDALEGGG